MKIGRNDPCHCGSGQKYKKCCASKDDAARSAELTAQAAARAQAAQDQAEQTEQPAQTPTLKGGTERKAKTDRRGVDAANLALPKSTALIRKRSV